MTEAELKDMLAKVQSGDLTIDDAISALRRLDVEMTTDGSARLDHHRKLRCGVGEVIFCQNKTPQQVTEIFSRLAVRGGNVLGTRANDIMAEAIQAAIPDVVYEPQAKALCLKQDASEPVGHIAVVAAGTSDLSVAEEARVTAEIMGSRVTTHYDVGVAGLHRLLAETDAIQQANVVVAVAGMEGALASVVGGLVAVPVIAIPTSVGYGASFGGVAALLAMLNSCASGVSVVNIDNGFGGGYNAAIINRMVCNKETA